METRAWTSVPYVVLDRLADFRMQRIPGSLATLRMANSQLITPPIHILERERDDFTRTQPIHRKKQQIA